MNNCSVSHSTVKKVDKVDRLKTLTVNLLTAFIAGCKWLTASVQKSDLIYAILRLLTTLQTVSDSFCLFSLNFEDFSPHQAVSDLI